ncbi:MAG: hypothetical protein ACSHYB_12885 [Roseibacillus sp.]
MNSHKSRHPLRWLVRAGLTIIILTLLGYAGSNLFLSTKPGQNFLQKNLNRRTYGISWQVAGASWSPWNGITVKKLTASLPTSQKAQKPLLPLLELQKVELKPYWGQLLRGKNLFREIILDKPQLNIPVEMLLIVEPTKPTTVLQPKVSPPPATKPKPPLPENQPAQKTKPKRTEKTKPQPQLEPKPIDEKRFWVRLRNANIRVYSMKLGQGINFHSFNANLPLGGPPTKGSLSWQKITLGKHLLASSSTLPIEWKSPTWTLPNQDLPLTLPQLADDALSAIPFDIRVGGSFSPRRASRDFRFQASLPSQPLSDYILHRDSRFHLRAKSITANIAARGALLNPNTWRFDSNAALDEIEVFSELREQHFHFETARARANLRNATLVAPDFSLRSERLSLLGNGQLHLGGYLLGVLRIVSDPELADRFTNVAIGSLISRGWTRRWLSPLETPDRFYRDLHFEGFLPNAQVNTGRRGEFIPFPELLSSLKAFTSMEVAEELPPPQTSNPSSPSNP